MTTADGCLTYRHNLPESDPVPGLTLLAASELSARLPASTTRVTADERVEIQRARRRAALARFRR